MSRHRFIEELRFSSPKIKSTFYVGKEAQINAGLGILCQALFDQKHRLPPLDYKILLFGQSGSGKSSFPEGLAKNFILNKDVSKLVRDEKKKCPWLNANFTLFHVKCNKMVSTFGDDETSLKRALKNLVSRIKEEAHAVVAFDELDAFTPERMRMAPLSPNVFYWTMDFMQENKRGLVVFGILNHPEMLETAVLAQISDLFYFKELDQRIVEQILKKRGMPYASDLALRLCTSTRFIVLGNELSNACDLLIRTRGQGDPRNLKNYGYEKIASFMMTRFKTSWDQRRKYENPKVDYIQNAKDAIIFWNEQYTHFLEDGLELKS